MNQGTKCTKGIKITGKIAYISDDFNSSINLAP